MKTTKLQLDETTYRTSYAGDDGYNARMEIKATEEGLEIDEHTTVPWEWILQALTHQGNTSRNRLEEALKSLEPAGAHKSEA